MTTHYFTGGGRCGESKHLIVVDTSEWSDDDWAEVSRAPAGIRVNVAAGIARKRESAISEPALELELEKLEIEN